MNLLRSVRVIHTSSFVTSRKMSPIVVPLLLSPRQANDYLKSKEAYVTFLDASWFMPNSPRNAKQEFLGKRIPGSQFLDLDEVASPSELGLKHMMPDNHTFAHACEKLGISPATHVVIYDTHGVFSAPRALFMFRAFGHTNSSVLNGGLPGWVNEQLPVESSMPSEPRPTTYSAPDFKEQAIRSYDQIVANSQHDPSTNLQSELVLDARPKGRFTGTDPEPRPGLSSGHIPHSVSLTFNLFLQKNKTIDGQEYTTFLPVDDIRRAVVNAVGPEEAERIFLGERPVVTSCGSGMTAGVLWLGLQLLGVKQLGLYDESWTGYAMRPSSQIQK